MDEAKRIVRYTLPGLVYVIFILATFVLLKPDKAKEIILSNDISIGEILGSLILSGGIGYIFSTIYFGFYWLIRGRKGGHFYNHLDILKELIESKKIKIIRPGLLDLKEQEFILNNKKEAWYIVNVFWYSRGKTSKTMEGISEKLNSYYSDITIGLGTTLVAALCSFFTFILLLFVYYSNISWWNAVACVVMYVIFIYMVGLNFRRTYKAYETMVITAFATEVFTECENDEHKNPVKIVFYENL